MIIIKAWLELIIAQAVGERFNQSTKEVNGSRSDNLLTIHCPCCTLVYRAIALLFFVQGGPGGAWMRTKPLSSPESKLKKIVSNWVLLGGTGRGTVPLACLMSKKMGHVISLTKYVLFLVLFAYFASKVIIAIQKLQNQGLDTSQQLYNILLIFTSIINLNICAWVMSLVICICRWLGHQYLCKTPTLCFIHLWQSAQIMMLHVGIEMFRGTCYMIAQVLIRRYSIWHTHLTWVTCCYHSTRLMGPLQICPK